MMLGNHWRAFERSIIGRRILFGVGVVVTFLIAPVVAPIPGPGGIPVAIAGITLMLRYSPWAKRRYVKLKRRWPRHVAWVDWGLRRASAKRRAALAKQGEAVN